MKTFYEIFKMGIEIELEVPEDRIEKYKNMSNEEIQNVEIVNDGSLNRTKNDTTCKELRCRIPIRTEEKEKEFFTKMKEILPEFKSTNGEDIFAHYNKSCGTHYHFSFKNRSDEFLYIYDCIDFEKFFYSEYMKEFKSEKFLSRINTNYCKNTALRSAKGEETKPRQILNDLQKIGIMEYEQESKEASGRYRWLNMVSVVEGTGVEIRIFPFLQTYSGVEKVTEFFKRVVIDYYNKPSTQEKLALLEIYEKQIKINEFKIHKLNTIKRMIYNATTEGRNKNQYTGELRMLLVKWIQKQPSLIKQEKAI